MRSNETKKHGLSPLASPDRSKQEEHEHHPSRSSAVTRASRKKAVQSKKKYKFAPVDTLTRGASSEPPVLQSLSLSQVRKSKVANAPRVDHDPNLVPKPPTTLKAVSKPSKASTSAVGVPKVLEDAPPEEVIWQYSPFKNPRADFSDRDRGYKSTSEDSAIEHVVKESSTPIVPNKFKRVLNFPHMHDGQEMLPDAAVMASKKSSLRTNSVPKSFSLQPPSRASTRDIDEIINDIEDGFEIKPPFQGKDIPSSPTKMVSQRLRERQGGIQEDSLLTNDSLFAHGGTKRVEVDDKLRCSSEDHCSKENKERTDNAESTGDENEEDDEDDESLIELLTQKFVSNPSNERGPTNHENEGANSQQSNLLSSDGTQDDSLLEYFQSSETGQHKADPSCAPEKVNFESTIESVEARFSQNVVVQENLNESEKWQSYVEKALCATSREGMERWVVIESKEFLVSNKGLQKVLKCLDHKGSVSNLVVRSPWSRLTFKEGDVVHTISGSNTTNRRLFSDDRDPETGKINDNLLILNPDILISATTVGRAVECERRALLSNQISGPGEPSLPALVGNIVHELVQMCLKYKLDHVHILQERMSSFLDGILDNYVADIIMCQSTKDALLQQITAEHIPNIKQFLDAFVKRDKSRTFPSARSFANKQEMSISNIIDIEENIWSPMYGLKGFIDATVETTLPNDSTFVAPLELKTGKFKSISHEAQGTIYNLLLSDRYELPVNFFLLFYTKTNDFTKHDTLLHSLKHLIVLRNHISEYLRHELSEVTENKWQGTTLPSILGSAACDNCYSKTECMVINNLCEDGSPKESGLKKGEYEALTGHLTGNRLNYKEFYMRYEDLIVKEESSLKGINNEIFLIDSKTRESLSGKCVSNLVIVASEDDSESKLIRYTFCRKEGAAESLPSLINSQLSKNDMVIISDEAGHFALCTGRVVSISTMEITISTSRRLQSNNVRAPGFEKGRKQVLETVLMPSKSAKLSQKSITYRIDRNEVQQGLALARFNLLNLFLPPVPEGAVTTDPSTGQEIAFKRSWGGDQKTREIVVDGRTPRFVAPSEPPRVPYDEGLKSRFNEDQWKAFEKVMRLDDYALILGMPGTGKTTLIVEIVKSLVARGKTILLTSYTHSAIDNILIKLKNCDIDICRLGHKHRVHQEAWEFVPDFTEASTFEKFKEQVEKPSVVATTCLNIHDTLLSLRSKDFDYVILDEASQLSLPICVGPLKFAERFVLVGDHYQLPPLVKNDAARVGGLDLSLFKMLCEKHPDSVVELTHQYRMCEDIMTLSNYLIYDGKLKCVSEEVRDQKLEIPHMAELDTMHVPGKHGQWLDIVLNSEKRVVFLDHDKCPSFQEIAEKDNIKNPGEAELVWQCVAAMVRCGVSRRDIGVMTLYRAQLRILRKMFEAEEHNELEILTADQFQGRDKRCVIISMVRSNDDLNGGSLLRELRRVNVAMTRAKCKLIIIGSKATISSVESLRGFMSLLESRGWLHSLPPDCLESYNIPRPAPSQHSRRKKQGSVVANITAESKFTQDKSVLRDTLNGM